MATGVSCTRPVTSPIAYRPANIGLLVGVGVHEAGRIARDVQLFEAETRQRGDPADRPQHAVERTELPAVGQLERQQSGSVAD